MWMLLCPVRWFALEDASPGPAQHSLAALPLEAPGCAPLPHPLHHVWQGDPHLHVHRLQHLHGAWAHALRGKSRFPAQARGRLACCMAGLRGLTSVASPLGMSRSAHRTVPMTMSTRCRLRGPGCRRTFWSMTVMVQHSGKSSRSPSPPRRPSRAKSREASTRRPPSEPHVLTGELKGRPCRRGISRVARQSPGRRSVMGSDDWCVIEGRSDGRGPGRGQWERVTPLTDRVCEGA
jgi:hypothetical protein